MGITAASLSKFGVILSGTLADAFPASILIGAATYACAWVPGPRGREALVNGQAIRLEGAVRIPFTALPLATPPAERALVTIAGVRYRIASVTSREHEGSHHLDLEQAGR